MEILSNIKLKSEQPLTRECSTKNLSYFNEVIDYVHQLPYGRNSDMSDFSLIIKEQKGTCSTKHAFLAQLAIENGFNYYRLYLGIYKMNFYNTPGVREVLQKYKLNYIPEAHTYLKTNDNQYLDVTRTTTGNASFKDSIVAEQVINPYQIGTFKLNWHQEILKSWLVKKSIQYSFEELWHIRELCINSLK